VLAAAANAVTAGQGGGGFFSEGMLTFLPVEDMVGLRKGRTNSMTYAYQQLESASPCGMHGRSLDDLFLSQSFSASLGGQQIVPFTLLNFMDTLPLRDLTADEGELNMTFNDTDGTAVLQRGSDTIASVPIRPYRTDSSGNLITAGAGLQTIILKAVNAEFSDLAGALEMAVAAGPKSLVEAAAAPGVRGGRAARLVALVRMAGNRTLLPTWPMDGVPRAMPANTAGIATLSSAQQWSSVTLFLPSDDALEAVIGSRALDLLEASGTAELLAAAQALAAPWLHIAEMSTSVGAEGMFQCYYSRLGDVCGTEVPAVFPAGSAAMGDTPTQA